MIGICEQHRKTVAKEVSDKLNGQVERFDDYSSIQVCNVCFECKESGHSSWICPTVRKGVVNLGKN